MAHVHVEERDAKRACALYLGEQPQTDMYMVRSAMPAKPALWTAAYSGIQKGGGAPEEIRTPNLLIRSRTIRLGASLTAYDFHAFRSGDYPMASTAISRLGPATPHATDPDPIGIP
jgi:hypothetical protein